MKYTSEQVLAALRDATAPISTADVSKVCRNTYGSDAGSVPSGGWGWGEPGEVNAALKKLAGQGAVVSAKWGERDNPNMHLAYNYTERQARYWATPELATKWQAVLDARAAALAAARANAERLDNLWQASGAGTLLRARVSQNTVTGEITFAIGGTDADLAHLVELLNQAAARRITEAARPY